MSEKVKHCGTCDFAKWQLAGYCHTRKRYYCQLKLQRARQTSGGKDSDSYIKYMDVACDRYTNYKE